MPHESVLLFMTDRYLSCGYITFYLPSHHFGVFSTSGLLCCREHLHVRFLCGHTFSFHLGIYTLGPLQTLFTFFIFFWLHPRHMEVPTPGIESEPPQRPRLQLQQHQILSPTAPGQGSNPCLHSDLSPCTWILNLSHQSGNSYVNSLRNSQTFPKWLPPFYSSTCSAGRFQFLCNSLPTHFSLNV